MPLCRLTGSYDSIQGPAATRPAFAVPGRYAQAHLALPIHREREQKGAALEHRGSRPDIAGPQDNGLPAGGARIERPRFSRLHASITSNGSRTGLGKIPSLTRRLHVLSSAQRRRGQGLVCPRLNCGSAASRLPSSRPASSRRSRLCSPAGFCRSRPGPEAI
jgi:hypothetical protein